MKLLSFRRVSILRSFLAFVYYLLLNFVYVQYQMKLFSYVGYTYTFNGWRLITGFIVYVLATLMLLPLKASSSSTAIYLIFYLSLAPFIILYQYETFSLWMVIYMIAMLALLEVLVLFLGRISLFKKKKTDNAAEKSEEKKSVEHSESKDKQSKQAKNNNFFKKLLKILKLEDNPLDTPPVTDNKLIINGAFLTVIAYTIVMLLINGLPNFALLGFDSISEIRAEASFGLVFELITNVMCKIIIPVLIVIYIDRKQPLQLAIVIIAQLYLYSITGFKTFLFILGIVIALRFVKRLSMQTTILLGLIGAVLASLVLYWLTHNNMTLALIINRVIFLPAKIKWAYLDYFSQNPFVLFSESTIAKIFGMTPVYDRSIPHMIGELYFGRPEQWTNTGFMADAYANLGWLGGILMSAVLAVELHFVDVATLKRDKGIAAVFIIFYISLNDGGLISISVSGGFILAILLFRLFVQKKKTQRLKIKVKKNVKA